MAKFGQICVSYTFGEMCPDRQTPQKTSVCALTTSRQNQRTKVRELGLAPRSALRAGRLSTGKSF